MLLLVAVVGLGYFGGGIAWARHQGSGVAHPHAALWREVLVLVMDGVAFSRQSGARKAGGYEVVTGARRAVKNSSSIRGVGSTTESIFLATSGSAGKKEKKEKREGREKKEKRESAGSGDSGKQRQSEVGKGDAVPAAFPPTVAAAGTASAGGGRWVHIPK